MTALEDAQTALAEFDKTPNDTPRKAQAAYDCVNALRALLEENERLRAYKFDAENLVEQVESAFERARAAEAKLADAQRRIDYLLTVPSNTHRDALTARAENALALAGLRKEVPRVQLYAGARGTGKRRALIDDLLSQASERGIVVEVVEFPQVTEEEES